MTPDRDAAKALEKGLEHHKAGRGDLADALYQRAIRSDPRNADAWYLRSVVAMSAGRYQDTIAFLERAVDLVPSNPIFLCNLGEAHRRLGQLDTAEEVFREAVRSSPTLAEAHFNLGLTLHEQGRPKEAIASYLTAIRCKPSLVVAESRLIRALVESGADEEAIARFDKNKPILPESVELLEAIGSALADTFRRRWHSGDAGVQHRLDEAIACLRRALALDPHRSSIHDALARALHDRGDLTEALFHLRRTVELSPDHVVAHSNLLFLLPFDPNVDARAIRAEAEQWEKRHASRVANELAPHRNLRDPDRRLRIGYVSPNFRNHCQAMFMVPLLEHHDRDRFEIHAYSVGRDRDSVTDREKACCHAWHEVGHLANDAIASLIRSHEIDILVDLTMHMGENRALLLARKPAPVQVCWLAYPGTTGLSAMDYRMSDVHLDPPGADESIYTEATLRLPDSFWVYDPLTDQPEVNALPALTNGYVTFGSLNTYRKMNTVTLDLWAPLLRALPDSRLILLAPPGEAKVRLAEALSVRGVDPRRLETVDHRPRAAYLATYQRIDLCLDPLPAHGHTTSLDAFWMGVPVLTMVGRTVLGRAGVCLAKNLELRDLIANCPDEFLELGKRWASDLGRLAELRKDLRRRMEQSPLMDARRFARNLEAAYREAWRIFCAGSV